ncbi:membrane protein [Enterococcus haemoperoxidus ATCC BAA-382]|uniref:Membrane protein n=1 Tax=Enterococcus haemoperoxidus ATCC BAA-382 TaxID=1158608 RepID=R2THM5_9ENTE|nr:TIGR03943 family protein [Enterococcus haemoperoxidus]EOH99609.1 membrane protein [Enterococcus haemoperoxidus ATCC BAA-382]EOT62651.1 membrane protein [Enterococcus haemoperoxidus ATCC BAA-382]
MIRFLILIGYTILMMYLQVSGRLNQYINVHYSYLAILSMALSFVLAIVQLILWNKEEDKKTEDHHNHAGHDHGLNKPYQRGIAYLLLSLPLIVGFMFPTISLDTSIVEAKGFNFPLSKESVGDPDVETQFLKPDTSIYFDKTDYNEQMKQALTKYVKDNHVTITDENYLEVMELIYNYPSEFIGKTISYKGFVFNSKQKEQLDTFVFRFGIIHCVADSGVFGLLTNMPENQTFNNNDWVELTGTIHSEYYAPFKREIPTIEVTKVKQVDEPKNQYVYRSF